MQDQRRHQRIRFSVQPPIKIGYSGQVARGKIENLSASGVMFRVDLPLAVDKTFGCEFKVFGSPKIDIAAPVVSRVGDLFGARFVSGPISDVLIQDTMDAALGDGQASIVSMHRVDGRRTMRIIGGLNGSLRNDFEYSLGKVGVDEIDVGQVTQVDEAGLQLCLHAVARKGACIGAQSPVFSAAWQRLEAEIGSVREES